MNPLPLPEQGELVVRYSLDSEETMSEAVVNAFLAVGVDVHDRPTRLVDWVSAEAFESFEWTSDRPLSLCTRVWDHRVQR
jgi:hypothetical protein